MMNSGPQKPPLAPKPKLAQAHRPGIPPATARSEGLSLPSPGPPKRVKPVLAPKPCISKLAAAVESKPKGPHQAPRAEIPRDVAQLNPHNGLHRENKKPDWDYIIPICLCSQENCRCFRAPSEAKTLHRVKTEGHGGILDNGERTDNGKSHVLSVCPPRTNTHLTFMKPQEQVLHSDTNSNKTSPGPAAKAKPSLPHRTWSDEANGNVRTPPGSPGSAPKEAPEQIYDSCLARPRAGPAKPVPVPRKARAAAAAPRERAETRGEGAAQQDGRERNAGGAAAASSEGKRAPHSSVSAPGRENTPTIVLTARKAGAPPAPPPKKKPLLSAPESAPTGTPDVEEEDLGWDVHEMEISVDEEAAEEEEEDGETEQDQAGVYATIAVATANEEEAVEWLPKKPQRHNGPMATAQRKEPSEDKQTEGRLGENLSRRPVPEERATRELPLLPEKPARNLLGAGLVKPQRSSLGKTKSKSFSGADAVSSDGRRTNSFRRLLDLKLSAMMHPRRRAKGGQSPDGRREQSVDGEPDATLGQRKFSCPLIGVEQSVDADEGDDYYENVRLYEEIPDYENVDAGPASTSAPASAWPGDLYDDEGIYEEQEPYMSFERREGNFQAPAPRTSADEGSAAPGDGLSEDEFVANASSSEEERENDSSSVSSKGDPEHPEEGAVQSGKKENKIHHIATEIMSSENVFVDVLKLLHLDFRDAVSKASRQNGKPVIEERLLKQILYYLPQLYELNQDLLRELRERLAQWDENARLADIFLKKGPYLKMYSTYIREFDKNVALLEEQTKRNAAFGAVVREFEATPRCAGLALRHHLLKPVQRIPQYQMLLTDYLKNQSEDSGDYKDTQAALALVKDVANHANDIIKQGDNFQKVIQVQCSLNGHHEIVQPGRIFLKEGVLMKLARKVMQPRKFFLFNDVLLYTTPVQSGQYKLNNMLSLAGMKVSKPSQEAYQNELNIESVERSFILSASAATERDAWLEAISTAISDYTKKKISFISGKSVDEVDLADSDDGASLGSKAPIWIPDLRATMCMICTCEFSLTWRRHHCRACGKVVCQSCSSNKDCLEYLKNQLARVCDQCFHVLQQKKSETSPTTTVSPGSKATFAFPRKQKKIPAALKEVSASTVDSSMSGYLHVSAGNKKQGKRLWFVIKDKVLYTYAASEDVAALRSQPLLGFVLKADSSQKLQFHLYHKNTLHYTFKADDAPTADRWIDSFKDATVL